MQDMDQKHVAHSLLNTSCLTLAMYGCLFDGRLKENQNYQRDCDCRIKYMNRKRLDHSCIKFKNDCYFYSYIHPFKLNLLGETMRDMTKNQLCNKAKIIQKHHLTTWIQSSYLNYFVAILAMLCMKRYKNSSNLLKYNDDLKTDDKEVIAQCKLADNIF